MLLNVWFSSFYNRLEKVTDENERISEELKFKEQKVQSLQRRLVQDISYPAICFDLKTCRFFCISWTWGSQQGQDVSKILVVRDRTDKPECDLVCGTKLELHVQETKITCKTTKHWNEKEEVNDTKKKSRKEFGTGKANVTNKAKKTNLVANKTSNWKRGKEPKNNTET